MKKPSPYLKQVQSSGDLGAKELARGLLSLRDDRMEKERRLFHEAMQELLRTRPVTPDEFYKLWTASYFVADDDGALMAYSGNPLFLLAMMEEGSVGLGVRGFYEESMVRRASVLAMSAANGISMNAWSKMSAFFTALYPTFAPLPVRWDARAISDWADEHSFYSLDAECVMNDVFDDAMLEIYRHLSQERTIETAARMLGVYREVFPRPKHPAPGDNPWGRLFDER
jgi:hypothetical protein